LVVNGVVSEDSTREINEHLDFHSVIHVDRSFVA
jgi:hypothetical protein